MRLIFIYGPPAVGKLTIARKIAALTGSKVFHNHLSIDCIEPVFEFGSPSFYKLIEKSGSMSSAKPPARMSV